MDALSPEGRANSLEDDIERIVLTRSVDRRLETKVLGRLDSTCSRKTAAVFGGSMIRDSKVFRRAVPAKFYAVRIAFFRRRFADSLKQGQPRMRCAGEKYCRRGWLEAT